MSGFSTENAQTLKATAIKIRGLMMELLHLVEELVPRTLQLDVLV
jgi:hypothetical protein